MPSVASLYYHALVNLTTKQLQQCNKNSYDGFETRKLDVSDLYAFDNLYAKIPKIQFNCDETNFFTDLDITLYVTPTKMYILGLVENLNLREFFCVLQQETDVLHGTNYVRVETLEKYTLDLRPPNYAKKYIWWR